MSKKTTNKKREAQVREARDTLWRMGELTWKLEPHQKSLYDFFKGNANRIIVWYASRRLGKSFTLLITAMEMCIKEPRTIVKYICPTQAMAREIISQIIPEIVADAPNDVLPSFKTQSTKYVFPNGSEIQLAGTDNKNYNKIRGGKSSLCIVDEAGFCSDLGIVVRSVLLPTTATTGGKVILSTTPPESIDHEITTFVEKAKMENAFALKTIYDAVEDSVQLEKPRLTLEIVQDLAKQYPEGENDVEFLREYMCKQETDKNLAVLPEFNEEVREDIVVSWPKPDFFDPYVSMDIGGRDLTAILFAYYDFQNDVLVIEDEFSISGNTFTSQDIVDEIRRKEQTYFVSPFDSTYIKPKLRVSDNNNPILLQDLSIKHGITFSTTRKDEKRAAINALRMEIKNRKIIINPRCTNLVHHMEAAIWSKSKDEFQRSADNGHYDFVDALIYLHRNVVKGSNPFPVGYNMGNRNNLFIPDSKKSNPVYKEFEKMLNPLTKRKRWGR